MSQQESTASEPAARLSGRVGVRRWGLLIAAALLALALAGPVTSSRTAGAKAHQANQDVSGAGKTIIEGGTGGATPMPVTTTVAFHASAQGGDFECLALAPPGATGAGSGEFSVNAMYVTGKVTSMEVTGDGATLQGTATVTGLGAGQSRPFTVLVTAGGPGATIVLSVSGLTFHEILLEGQINVGQADGTQGQ